MVLAYYLAIFELESSKDVADFGRQAETSRPLERSSSLLSPAIILRSSTSTVAIDSVAAVRVTLINDTSVLSLLDVLVLEAGTRSKVDSDSPLGVGASVSRSRQGNCVGGVPAAQSGDTANDEDGFAVCGGLLLVEGYGDGGGGCAGAASCGCGGGGWRAGVAPVGVCGCGARSGGGAAGAGAGQLGLGENVSDV